MNSKRECETFYTHTQLSHRFGRVRTLSNTNSNSIAYVEYVVTSTLLTSSNSSMRLAIFFSRNQHPQITLKQLSNRH